MILYKKKQRRNFTVSNEDLNYLVKLLSYDPGFNTHLLLLSEDHLETEDSANLIWKINQCLDTLDIYDYYTNNGETIPVINPDSKFLSQGYILNPISNQKKYFLNKLTEFLVTREPIEIK